jgi:hypothetical protein
MRTLIIALLAVTALSACGGPSLSPEQKASRTANIAKTDAALKSAQNVMVDGKTFRVATIADKSYALVELQGPSLPYTVAEIERAASSVTGCNSTFEPGILAFLSGDITTLDLSVVRSKVSGRFNGWRVDLAC